MIRSTIAPSRNCQFYAAELLRQPLSEPSDCTILSSSHGFPLTLRILIAFRQAPVRNAREMHPL
jgi:hypothetical protein